MRLNGERNRINGALRCFPCSDVRSDASDEVVENITLRRSAPLCEVRVSSGQILPAKPRIR